MTVSDKPHKCFCVSGGLPLLCFNLQCPLLVPVVEPSFPGWWMPLGDALEAEAYSREGVIRSLGAGQLDFVVDSCLAYWSMMLTASATHLHLHEPSASSLPSGHDGVDHSEMLSPNQSFFL